jgi:DNA polymerase (family 10)
VPLSNADVARVFEEIADLMEIRGDDGFRVNAYRRVARTIEDLASDISQIAARGELAGLPGIGKATAEKIETLLRTGSLPLRAELCAEIPETLLKLREIPGLGPKKIALLWRERGIDSLDSLRNALTTNALAGLKGFGDKTIDSLRRGLEFLATTTGRTRLGIAASIAEAMIYHLRQLAGVEHIEPAGSLRRGSETVGDIDLLCIAAEGGPVIREFTQHPHVAEVLGAGDTKGSVRFQYASDRQIQIDLRVIPAASFGAALQYFTGSKAHNVRLRERAVKRGWSLNEYGLTEGERVIASRHERDIYEALGLPWVPPELREDRGEFDGPPPPDLLTVADIQGELHMHTAASDGRNTIDEMVMGAKARGYKYICITDHSRSSVIANGLSVDRLLQHMQMVREAQARHPDFTLWVGAEVDILSDGSLDYPDEILAQLDFVVASVHAGMGQDREQNTKRTLAAIRNPYVNLIAHPTGRMINRRDAMPLDLEAICAAAAETGTALEINASNFRLDLKDQHARFAAERGVMLCIDCDAHHFEQFDQLRFGVMTARRGWIRKDQVLNTRDAAGVREFVNAKRRRMLSR